MEADPSDMLLWVHVSEQVKDKTPDECYTKWWEGHNQKVPAPVKRKKADSPLVLEGKRGTGKYMRAVRRLLDQVIFIYICVVFYFVLERQTSKARCSGRQSHLLSL